MKKEKLKIFILLGVAFILVIMFIVINTMISNKKERYIKVIPDSNKYCYQIEDMLINDSKLELSGWFFRLKKVQNVYQFFSDNEFSIFLIDIDEYTPDENETDLGIAMELSFHKRDDINAYYLCEYDYSECGFTATVCSDLIDLNGKIYQIYIKPDKTIEDAIATNIYINKGILEFTDPFDRMVLDVANTDLEEIVNNGVCLSSNAKAGVCIYQLNWDLYWITDEKFYFEDDGSTRLEYQIETTQFDKLPQQRTKDNHFWDNIGDSFENFEITNMINCGKYRVCKRHIPEDYAVTLITTGYHPNTYVWNALLRPIIICN